jgi:DNA-binding NtrC family response regulator
MLDIFMPNCNGLNLLLQIKKEYPDQKVIIISGFGNIPIAIEAIKSGAIDFIEKPLNLDEILSKIAFLKKTDKKAEPTENKTDKDLLRSCDIIGESNLFLELIQQAERLAPHNFPVLIYGEHGTGKSTIANYIYKKSESKKDSFIEIDCESFTQKKFSQINLLKKQTIYFKHVDALDSTSQSQLKEFIETISQERLIRVIASSREALFQLMREKKFNATLFYFLNKAPLEVPPLRKRPYDIPLLINHLLKKYNNTHAKKVILTTQSIRLLRNHNWPGNIIELEQAIEKIVIHSQDYEVVSLSSLANIMGEKTVQFIEEQSIAHFSSIEEATKAFKKNFLLYLLQKNHYNINQVSRRLSLSPIQLKNTLLELQIDIQETEGNTHGRTKRANNQRE